MEDISHKRCCFSPLDRARHELDRGIKAVNRMRGTNQEADNLTQWKRATQHVKKWTQRLSEMERRIIDYDAGKTPF